jgi:hypothetical protein
MRPNLDSLHEEILAYLESEHFVIFRCLSRGHEDGEFVFWDTQRSPDYKPFLECALKLGIRLIHFHAREFRAHHREEALELLEQCDLARDEKRSIERRIEELAIYEGFTCAIEMSFDFESRVYLFEVQTEWYAEWHEILDELEASGPEGPDRAGYGGFYSNN